MFCSKCGTENVDGSNVCRGCGSVLTIEGPGAEAVAAKTSGLAIASLVLGILSFCSCLLTAPISFILGIIALVKISKSNGRLKGTGFAVAGIVIPVVAIPIISIMMAILMPALSSARDAARQAVCASNLKQLSIAATMYAEEKGQYPTADKWCDLLEPYYKNEKILVCPGAGRPEAGEGRCDYAINPNAKKGCPADMVLFFESKPGWNPAGGPELAATENHHKDGCNVAFCDGRVEFVKAEDIDSLKWTAGP
jgi:prepilin-type processing-associated H-X9-DG protein